MTTKPLQKLLLICIAFLLTSCIQVDDFGNYWDKAELDPAIAGHWKTKMEADEHGIMGNDEINYFVQGAAYQEFDYQCKMEKQGKRCEASAPSYPIKTLIIGHYHFIASKGEMTRYIATKSTLKAYDVNIEAVWAFLENHYPHMKNLTREEVGAGVGERTYTLKIKVLDDDVAEMLANIPDNKTYWKVTGTLTR